MLAVLILMLVVMVMMVVMDFVKTIAMLHFIDIYEKFHAPMTVTGEVKINGEESNG